MRYRTELAEAILTDDTARKIIDFVSPIYGNSYVALWCFQAMGVVLGKISGIANALNKEMTPSTADLFLDYWEDYYRLPRKSSLTKEQRRERLMAATQERAPFNPRKVENILSGTVGVPVEITENVAKNKFLVNVREVIPSIVPLVAVLERIKPAHLIYDIQVATEVVAEADIKTAVAMTRGESYRIEVTE